MLRVVKAHVMPRYPSPVILDRLAPFKLPVYGRSDRDGNLKLRSSCLSMRGNRNNNTRERRAMQAFSGLFFNFGEKGPKNALFYLVSQANGLFQLM